MVDRVNTGFIGGFIAAIAMNIVDYFLVFIGFDREGLYQWGSVVIFGKIAGNLSEMILGQFAQIFFAGFLGIIFAYIYSKLDKTLPIFKGWIYGVLVWFLVYAVAIAIRLPYLQTHSVNSTISHIITASVYGVVLW
jgi:hypothetical protein